MNLKSLSNSELHEKTKSLAHEERRVTVEIIRHLREVEDRRLYAERGFGSLLEYCVKEFGYSESSAMRRISAVRVTRDLPEIESKIEQGRLTLSNIALSQIFFRAEEKQTHIKVPMKAKREVLEALENRSTRQAEKTLFEMRPGVSFSNPKKEEVRISRTTSKIEIVLTDEELEEVKKLKLLMSHVDPNLSHKELFMRLVRQELKERDPENRKTEAKSVRRKSERNLTDRESENNHVGRWAENKQSVSEKRESKRQVTLLTLPPDKYDQRKAKPAPVLSSTSSNGPFGEHRKTHLPEFKKYSRYISATVRREVWQRDGGCCTFEDPSTGRKCESRHRLQVDHKVPFAMGGNSTTDNLRLLCQMHNGFAALKVFGKSKMTAYKTEIENPRGK